MSFVAVAPSTHSLAGSSLWSPSNRRHLHCILFSPTRATSPCTREEKQQVVASSPAAAASARVAAPAAFGGSPSTGGSPMTMGSCVRSQPAVLLSAGDSYSTPATGAGHETGGLRHSGRMHTPTTPGGMVPTDEDSLLKVMRRTTARNLDTPIAGESRHYGGDMWPIGAVGQGGVYPAWMAI